MTITETDAGDPALRPPYTNAQFSARLDDLVKTIDGIRYALAEDSAGVIDPDGFTEARNLLRSLREQTNGLSQPLREVETPGFDREAVLLDAVDRISPRTRYGYVKYAELAAASSDARYNAHYYYRDAEGNRRYAMPLHDLVERLVAEGVLERSTNGDYRRPGQKGLGKRVGEPTYSHNRRA